MQFTFRKRYNKAGVLINGACTFSYQSGEPFSIRSGVLTANNTAQSRAALKPGVALPQAQLQEKAGVIGPVFFQNADAFTFPEPGGLGRNIFQGPSYWNLDAGVTKGFEVTERVRMVLRAEFFNALTASSATTNQNGESWRVVQLALKLTF